MHIPPAGGPRQWAVSCACASVPKRADCHPPLSSTPRGQARNPVKRALPSCLLLMKGLDLTLELSKYLDTGRPSRAPRCAAAYFLYRVNQPRTNCGVNGGTNTRRNPDPCRHRCSSPATRAAPCCVSVAGSSFPSVCTSTRPRCRARERTPAFSSLFTSRGFVLKPTQWRELPKQNQVGSTVSGTV
jgi:hypothetical protein